MNIDERRLALIQFVSREYATLLGPFNMAFAVILGSGAAWTLAFGFNWAIAVIGFAAVVVAFPTSARYYSQRFGRVRPCPSTAPQTWIQRFSWLFGVAVAGTLIFDEEFQGAGIPSLFFVWMSAPILWRAISDWRFQAHWALVSAAGLLGSVMFVYVESGDSQEEWMASSLSLISVALFIAGWLDHRLVVRALGGGTPSNEGSELNEPVIR